MHDWPLTLCDRRTVNRTRTIATDIVTQHYENENTKLYYDEAHRWYYWDGLEIDEAVVFQQFDSNDDRAGPQSLTFGISVVVC